MRTRLKLAAAAALLAVNVALVAAPRSANATVPAEKVHVGSCWNCYVSPNTTAPCCMDDCLASCNCSRSTHCG